jgi:ABC-type Fe3+/spermidine/putrescine transport system ATPase subunit
MSGEQKTSASQGVRLEHISKRFGSVTAVNDVSLEIRPGEFFSLLGPSGCGKTTLLRIVAGFETPDTGSIFVGERDVTRAAPQKRPTAMVFQNYALFPTMTVAQNVGYGLQARKTPRREQAKRVTDVLATVDLTGYETRPVTALSGGQQQRVAVARALAVRPAVLLFDEPLSNLDVALREQTRRELKLLQTRLGTTSIYVTHDQQEALAVSDRIGVMQAGKLVEMGSPDELYNESKTAFVAEFLGSNVIRNPRIASLLAGEEAPQGKALAVRPEHIRFIEGGRIQGRVRGRYFLGMYGEWWIDLDGETLRVWEQPSEQPGEAVSLEVIRSRWVTL